MVNRYPPEPQYYGEPIPEPFDPTEPIRSESEVRRTDSAEDFAELVNGVNSVLAPLFGAARQSRYPVAAQSAGFRARSVIGLDSPWYEQAAYIGASSLLGAPNPLVMVGTTIYAGAEVSIYNTLAALDKRGVDVRVEIAAGIETFRGQSAGVIARTGGDHATALPPSLRPDPQGGHSPLSGAHERWARPQVEAILGEVDRGELRALLAYAARNDLTPEQAAYLRVFPELSDTFGVAPPADRGAQAGVSGSAALSPDFYVDAVEAFARPAGREALPPDFYVEALEAFFGPAGPEALPPDFYVEGLEEFFGLIAGEAPPIEKAAPKPSFASNVEFQVDILTNLALGQAGAEVGEPPDPERTIEALNDALARGANPLAALIAADALLQESGTSEDIEGGP